MMVLSVPCYLLAGRMKLNTFTLHAHKTTLAIYVPYLRGTPPPLPHTPTGEMVYICHDSTWTVPNIKATIMP